MSVTINARGTSHPTFRIGKSGPTLSATGDITAPTGSNLMINADDGHGLTVNTPGTTATIGTDNQILNLIGDTVQINGVAFPAQTGTEGQVLVADSQGNMAWGGVVSLENPRSITATGDASWTVDFDGSANVSSTLTLADTGVQAGEYTQVVVDSKGRVISAANPNTLAGYGITDAAPKAHVGSSGNAHALVTTTTAGFMSPSDKIRLDSIPDTDGIAPLNPLLIYYGYPIAYKGLWDTDAVIADISANYRYWVVGHTYQDPAHAEYASTVTIMQAVRAAGVKVYGYIPLGTTSYNYTVAEIGGITDQWIDIGVDGIFLDEYGFDYGNTRQRQVDVVDLIHGKGLPICANAWVFEEFVCDTLAETGWPSGDWKYVRWETYNPTNISSPIAPGDSYLIENFCFDHEGPSNIWDTQERAEHVGELAKTKDVELWAVAVFGETTPGTLDTSKIGSLQNLDQCGEYISANAFLYDITIVGSGGFSFGSNSTPLWATIYRMPGIATVPDLPASNDYTAKTGVRYFGPVRLEITNTDVLQQVTVTGDDISVIGQNNRDHEQLVAHIADTDNPHEVTKTQIGLGSVDNTSDLDKPVSTAVQAALDDKADATHAHIVTDVTGLQTALDSKVDDSNGTAVGLTLASGYTETVGLVSGTTPALTPNNGSIQTWTLTSASIPTSGAWTDGQSIVLMVNAGASGSITWTSIGVTWKTNGGTAPVLLTSGVTPIVLVKVAGVIYGWRGGDA